MTSRFARPTHPLVLLAVLMVAGATTTGCQSPPEFNPTPTAAETDALTDPIQLTHHFNAAGEAYFSPDMQWIVFQAMVQPTDYYGMYVAQLKWEGDRITGIRTPIRITPEGSWNTCGSFSADGNSLIFASTKSPLPKADSGPPGTVGPGGTATRPAAATRPATGPGPRQGGYTWIKPDQAEIYRADGWKGAVSALPPGAGTDLVQHALTKNDKHDAECAYSPDGKWIVYTSRASGDLELWAMRADGSKQVQLTNAPGYDGGAFFSPDGKRLCYRSDRKGDEYLQVFVADLRFDAAGDIAGIDNERQLTVDRPVAENRPLNFGGNVINWGPYWHPDNQHLIWATSVHGQRNFELYLMRADGTHKTRVTHTEGSDVLPAFSPDGKWLMWTTRRGPERTSQIWLARFRMPKGA
jgi:dipeptidyl aminopeptidase/acylaminoacyl peptidase